MRRLFIFFRRFVSWGRLRRSDFAFLEKLRGSRFLVTVGGLILVSFITLSMFFVERSSGEFNIDMERSRLRAAGTDLNSTLLASMKDVISRGGVAGAEAIVRAEFAQLRLDLVECHHLMHVIGHESLWFYNFDLDAVAQHVSHFCELGYQHGAEAELVTARGLEPEIHRKFCEVIRRHHPGQICYKGVGHSVLSATRDVRHALQICESIVPGDQEGDLNTCYQGVFNDLTNAVSGIDSDTGLYLSGPPLMKLPNTPLNYCASFPQRYQQPCIFELGGHMHTVAQGDHTNAMLECFKGDHGEYLTAECIRAVSAIIAQKYFDKSVSSDMVTVPINALAMTWKAPFRKAYILGIVGELAEAERWGVRTNLKSFCAALGDLSDRDYCLQFVRKE